MPHILCRVVVDNLLGEQLSWRNEGSKMTGEVNKPFRVMCTSADQPRPHFEYFSTREKAEQWAQTAIKARRFGQICIEQMFEDGRWKLVAAHTTAH